MEPTKKQPDLADALHDVLMQTAVTYRLDGILKWLSRNRIVNWLARHLPDDLARRSRPDDLG